MAIGFDCGTYTLICCQRDDKGNFVQKKEVNAFIEMNIGNKSVFNMMKSVGVPLMEMEDLGVAFAMGEAAVDMAYTMGEIELKRPMVHGCLNPRERLAQRVMSNMIQGLLDEVKVDKETLYFSVPANAINQETDKDYHEKILEAIFKDFTHPETGFIVKPYPVNEGLALVYAELGNKAYTGIGISYGAGMVNICFAIYGAPVFEFSLVNSGDWIDKMAGKATGESPTYINKEKLKTDLTIEKPELLVQRAIRVQYEIMVQKAVTGIKKGLAEAGNKARTDDPIDIIVAGGTSSPDGFEQMFKEIVDAAHLPIEVGKIIKPKDPLYSVARGCLIAAEAADKS